jgi:ketosteroid isomerase-like protein
VAPPRAAAEAAGTVGMSLSSAAAGTALMVSERPRSWCSYRARVRRVEIVQELWHAWNTGIHDEVLQHLSDDAIVRPSELTIRSFKGIDELNTMRADLERLGIAVASTPFSWEEHGEDVIVQGRSRVTRSGQAEDLRPAWLFRFKGQKVVLIQTFMTYEEALSAAVGLRSPS